MKYHAIIGNHYFDPTIGFHMHTFSIARKSLGVVTLKTHAKIL